MLSNYLKIAWRSIVGNPTFSAINIIGLSIGLACGIIITLFVQYELSYDKHWVDADRTYRVTRDFYGNDLRLAAIAPIIAPLLAEDYPEIEKITRILTAPGVTIARGELRTHQDGVAFADANVLEFFGLKMVSGNPATALEEPTSVVLSQRAVEKYFGSEDPVGQTLNFMGQVDLKVTAVFENLPPNTHMAMDVIGSIAMLPLMTNPDELENWGSNNYYTYLRLPEGYNPGDLSSRFPEFLIKHRGKDAPSGTGLNLQYLPDIHLTSNRDSEWQPNGSTAVVYTFSAVALVVLLIACVNFMNLTTARATQRAREVGVRKVIGARRSQLITQFLGESMILTAFSMLLAVAIVELTLPAFALFLDKPLTFSLADPASLGMLIFGIVAVGLLAGSYPAFYLSRFRPVDVLKGDASATGSALLRKSLVVFQFATSIALLIATGVVVAQMQYVRDIDLGYDKSRNLVSRLPYFADLFKLYPTMKTELEAHPDIESVVYSSRLLGEQNLDGSPYVPEGVQRSSESAQVLANIKVDYQWFDHFDVEFLAGRPFRQNEMQVAMPTDDNPVTRGWIILNESAVKRFGWTPAEAVGKIIHQPTRREYDRFIDREVVGVVADIHFSSLHDQIKATAYAEPNPEFGRNISVKLVAGDHRDAIAHFEAVWEKLVPSDPVFWEFLDDRFNALYRAEQRQAQMFGMFSVFAVFVATLGLFGLASFTTERRTKEIGIRKVMGASVRDIVWLLTSDFTRLVILANVIAWPVAFYFMTRWLARFVYRAPFSEWAWLFVAAALVALGAAWLTIALQATRAATARPVLALRYE